MVFVMTLTLDDVKSGFDSNGNATLNIPNGAVIKAWKFQEGDTGDLSQQVVIVFEIEKPQTTPGTHPRMFQLWPKGMDLPSNYKDYKAGPLPYGPNKVIVNCIEVFPEHPETGSFNPESAVIT
jgi:hypothetical protein